MLTTGGAVLHAVAALRAEGAVVETALLVIDRDSGGRENHADAGVSLRTLYGLTDLEEAMTPRADNKHSWEDLSRGAAERSKDVGQT